MLLRAVMAVVSICRKIPCQWAQLKKLHTYRICNGDETTTFVLGYGRNVEVPRHVLLRYHQCGHLSYLIDISLLIAA